MIYGNLPLEIPDSRQTNFQNDQSEWVTYYWKLKTPDKLIFNMIKGGAGVGGIIDLVQWSEGDLSTRFLPFMCDVKAAYTILTTLIPLEEYLHIATVSFFS